jgi:hypothetical protein
MEKINHHKFLINTYNIYSFTDCINFIKKNKNIQTNKRVLHSSWIVYGTKYIVITDELVDFYRYSKILVGDKSSIFNFFNEFINKYHDKFEFLDNTNTTINFLIKTEYDYFTKSKIKNI